MIYFQGKISILLSIFATISLTSCKQGKYFSQKDEKSNVSAANSGERTLEKDAPEVFVFLNKWSKEAKSQGFKPTVRQNEDMSVPDMKKNLDEASSTIQCFKVGNDHLRTLATFFKVSSAELGLNPSPTVLTQFKGLFKKPFFGNKSRVCDLGTLENNKAYSSRVWISGDDKFNLQLTLMKK